MGIRVDRRAIKDTEKVFHLRRPTDAEIHGQILSVRGRSFSDPTFLSLNGLPVTQDIGPFARDRSKSSLGFGEAVFQAAKRAFATWQMFDLGWVRIVNLKAPIEFGQIIAVEVCALGLWSVNLSEIRETIDVKNEYGFIYATTKQHVEQGEESFLIRLDPVAGEVSYELEAVSRPRHLLAKLGFPVTRSYQHRFARDSHRRMREAVNLNL